MRSILLAASVVSFALLASAARADEVEYSGPHAALATSRDTTPIITPDVTYEGQHAVFVKDGPGPGRAFVASHDDVRYEADALPSTSLPVRHDEARCAVAQMVPGCPHHG